MERQEAGGGRAEGQARKRDAEKGGGDGPRRRQLPAPPSPRLVTEPAELRALSKRWLRSDALALDTEFVRTRTYYPKLGLIQVGDHEGLFLVDAVVLDRFQPFVEVLRSERVVKVLHSPAEDLEVFQHFFGSMPEPLFDTQVAAALCGLGASLGYTSLVERLFGIELPKHQQRSNWLRRPLSEAQVRYAALDVAYLLPAHEILVERLLALGRVGWAEEEFRILLEEGRARLDPGRIVERLLRSSMSPIQRATLEALVRWREAEAAERDLPRNFVIRDEVLLELARSRPGSRRQLERVRSLGAKERTRYGRTLLSLIQAARAVDGPRSRPGGGSSRSRRGQVNELRDFVQSIAEELELPPEFLARRRWLEELARGFAAGSRELPSSLEGWRREVIGEPLLRRLEESAGKR